MCRLLGGSDCVYKQPQIFVSFTFWISIIGSSTGIILFSAVVAASDFWRQAKKNLYGLISFFHGDNKGTVESTPSPKQLPTPKERSATFTEHSKAATTEPITA